MTDIHRVLVTGGCGFIGTNLIRLLRARTDWQLRVVDDLRTGRREYLPDDLAEVVVGDAGDPAVIEPALRDVDAVVHLASQTGVAPSVEDPAGDFDGNLGTTFRVLDACRRAGVAGFVFASSGAAAGEVAPPIHEEVVAKPVSPYGASKLAGEAYCRAFAATYGMRTAALRFSNVYGPYSAHKRINAVPRFVQWCLTGQDLVIYGDGGQTRDFIFVDDLSDAIVRALVADAPGGEVYQVATGVETSVGELAELTRSVIGAEVGIHHEDRRAGDVYRTSVDISKIRRVLGFEPRVPLAEGIARTADWYREHWLPTARA